MVPNLRELKNRSSRKDTNRAVNIWWILKSAKSGEGRDYYRLRCLLKTSEDMDAISSLEK